MSKLKIVIATGVALMAGGILSSSARAQGFIYGPRIVGPRVVARAIVPVPIAAPVYRPAIVAPVVSAYRPTYSSYVAPAAAVHISSYGAYRPVLTAPVYTAPSVVTTRIRPAVVGPGIGGLPNVYVPGQPVRNALRFAIP